MDPALSRRGMIIGGALTGLGALAALALRGGASTPVRVEGSSALSPFMLAASEGFRRSHAGEAIEVRSTDETRALRGLRAGTVDIAMLGRELSPDERDLVGTRVALDGVALIVHADNHVGLLPPEAAQELFAGVKRDWPGYGGPSTDVALFVRPEGSAARAAVHGLLGVTRVRADAEVVEGDRQLITRVGGTLGAIGYGSIAMTEAAIRQGATVRMLPVQNVEASMATVSAGRYPLRVVLTLATRRSPGATARALMDYVRSGVGQSVLRAQGYTPAT